MQRERKADEINEEMTVIAKLLDGLIDYAGLYPPGSLDMQALTRNYHSYRHGRHAYALGRLVVDLKRMEELRKAAGECLQQFPLSLILTAEQDLDGLLRLLDEGLKIEAVEIKTETLSEIERIAKRLPVEVLTFFEVVVAAGDAKVLDAICAAGAQVKLRMGGWSRMHSHHRVQRQACCRRSPIAILCSKQQQDCIIRCVRAIRTHTHQTAHLE